jgi:hypothetical protein
VKTSKAFVWPKDGRNGTTWGRFKDILQNKGPDIYLTINADKQDYIHNRPLKDRWAGYARFDDVDGSWPFSSKLAPWTQKGILGGRMPGLKYDFRTRKYGVPSPRMWTNAVWQPEPRKNKHNRYPEAYCDINGDWFQDYHYVPQVFGGPVSNERGKGIRGWGEVPWRP